MKKHWKKMEEMGLIEFPKEMTRRSARKISPGRNYTPELVSEIVGRSVAGDSAMQIAKDLNMPVSSIWTVKNRNGKAIFLTFKEIEKIKAIRKRSQS